MLWQAKCRRPNVIVWPRHFAHVFPLLCGVVETMDQRSVTIVLLAIPTQHIKLAFHYSAPCTYMWHGQRRNSRP